MKKTLLLADDSPTIQKVINLTFADEGIDVIAVGDGNAAIQQLRELKPDLVMADVHMPGLNGYQICERIRQNAELSKVPVILLVGSFEPFDEEEAKRVGADDFLMKPFQSIRQLVSRVAALLDAAPEEAPEAPEESEEPAEPVETAPPEETEPAAQTVSPAEIHTAASLTPEDVFKAPWPEDSSEAVTVETSLEEIAEKDDLSDFDSEFDRTFPDAASLSSQYVSAAKFEPRDETSLEPVESIEQEDTAKTEAFSEAEPVETPQAQMPERVLDEPDEDEEQTPVAPEGASILDLGYPGASADVSEEEAMLEISEREAIAGDEQALIPQTAEPVADKPAKFTESEPEPEPEPEQYDFREPDAFDDDGDIRESFHGLQDVEETPAVSFQTPLEQFSAAEPSEVSTDQADGFSAVSEASPAPRQISPDAIEAIAQRVFEKLSEKVVRELAREVAPEMKDLIARELAKENNENE